MTGQIIGSKGGGGASFVTKPDSLRSNDSFEILFGLGSGRWKGLVNGLKGLKINGVPMENADGTSNFQEIYAIFADGNPLEQQLVNFKLGGGGGATQSVNTPLVNPNVGTPGPWVSGAISTLNANLIDLRFVVSQLFYQDKKSIRENTASIEIQMRPSGSATWINPFTAPVSNAVTYNADGYNYTDSLFSNASYKLLAGRELFNANGTGFKASNSTNLQITGKTNSSYVKELRISVPSTGTYANKSWEVRARLIEKDTIDNNDIQERRAIAFESIAGIISTPLGNHPDWAGLVHMQVHGKASDQFSGFPEIEGIFDTKICKVPPPSVFNAATRAYTNATWDGSYQEHFTRDPAWQIKEFVEDPIHGIAGLQPGSTLDKWDALEASKYYSELVPNGKGGTHPRFSLNVTLNEARDVEEMMGYLAGAVNSYTEEVGQGTWRLKVDKPETPVMLFTEDNVFGEFGYSHTDVDTRFNDWRGTFIDEDLGYEVNTAQVFDQADIDLNGIRFTEIALIGCTNHQEAMRRLMFRMRVSLKEYKIVTFQTNRVARYLSPLSTILIADGALNDDHLIKSTSRIGSYSGATVTLKRPVRLEIGVNYTMHFTTKSKQTISRTVTNAAGARGDVTIITLNSALPADVMQDSAVSLQAVGLPSNPLSYRVIGIEPEDDNEDSYTIIASLVDSGKWNAMDNVSAQAIQSQQSKIFIDPPTAPAGGMFETIAYTTEFEVKRALQVNWNRPAGNYLEGYKVEYKFNDGPLKLLAANLSDSVIEIEKPEDGQYEFFITALDRRGVQSTPLTAKFALDGSRVFRAPTHLRGTLANRPSTAPYEGFRYTVTDAVPPVTQVWENGVWKEETNLVKKGSDIGVEDGATVGMTDAEALAFGDLQTVYGTTVSAAASATQAAASALQTANDKLATAANVVLTNASVGQAETARAASEAAKVLSESASTISAQQQVLATAAKDAAELAATSATGQAVIADGKAVIATNAASAAATSQTLTSGFSAEAYKNTIQTMPSDFAAGGNFFAGLTGTETASERPEQIYPITYPDTPQGKVLRVGNTAAGYVHISVRKRLLVAEHARRWKLTVRYRLNAAPPTGTTSIAFSAYGLTSNYNNIVYSGYLDENVMGDGASGFRSMGAVGVVESASYFFSASPTITPDFQGYSAAYMVPGVYFFNQVNGGGLVGEPEILSMKLEDVTESSLAKNEATIATTQATAATSAASSAATNTTLSATYRTEAANTLASLYPQAIQQTSFCTGEQRQVYPMAATAAAPDNNFNAAKTKIQVEMGVSTYGAGIWLRGISPIVAGKTLRATIKMQSIAAVGGVNHGAWYGQFFTDAGYLTETVSAAVFPIATGAMTNYSIDVVLSSILTAYPTAKYFRLGMLFNRDASLNNLLTGSRTDAESFYMEDVSSEVTATSKAVIATDQATIATSAGSTATTQANLSATYRDQSLGHANTASGHATTATNQAGIATSQATTATGAASTATTQTSLAATHASSAAAASKATYPDNFTDPAAWQNWGNWGGTSSFSNGIAYTYNGGSIRSAYVVPIAAGKRYRFTVRHRRVNQGGGTTYVGPILLPAGVLYQWAPGIDGISPPAVGTWQTLTGEISADTQLAAYPAATGFQIGGLFGYQLVSDSEISMLGVEDITSEYASAGSATVSIAQAAIATDKASIATDKANLAAQHVTTAAGSATTATTQAGISTDKAAIATTAASTATTQSNLSASFVQQNKQLMQYNRGFDFNLDGWGSAADGSGTPIGSTTTAWEGGTYWFSPSPSPSNIFSKTVYPVDTTRKYRFRARIGTYNSGATGITALHYAGFIGCDAAGNSLNHGPFGSYRYAATVSGLTQTDGQVNTFEQVVTGEGNDSWLKFPPGTKTVRLLALLNQNANTVNSYLGTLEFEDVTESQSAASQATISAAQATIATDKAAAATSASGLSATYRDQALGYRDTAESKATIATQQATIASTQAAAAQSSMTLTASLTISSLMANPVFANYPATSGAPPYWYNYTGTDVNYRTAGLNGLGYSVSWDANPGETRGIYASRGANSGLDKHKPGYYVAETDFIIRAGRLNQISMYAQAVNSVGAEVQSFNVPFDSDINNQYGVALGAGESNKLYSFKKLCNFTAPTTEAYNLYFFHGGGDSGQGKHPTIYKLSLRPATPEEIKTLTVLAPAVNDIATHTSQIAALVTADVSAASSITALTASIGGQAGPSLNANPSFGDWPGGSGSIPIGWANWSNGGANTKVAGDNGGYAFEQTMAPGVEIGILQSPPAMQGKKAEGWYVVEADVTLVSGTLVSAGIFFVQQGITGYTLHFGVDPDNTGVVPGNGVAGKRYNFSKLFNFTNSGSTNWTLYMMSGWSGFSGIQAKTIKWHRCSVREATPAEVRDQTVLPTAVANIATHTTQISALVTQDVAIASSITTLTATIGGQTSDAYNRNPRFGDWPAGQAYPTDWQAWSGGSVTRVAGDVGGYNLEQTVVATQDAGILAYPAGMVNKKSGGWHVLTGELTLLSGTLVGAAAYIYRSGWSTSFGFNAEIDPVTGAAYGNGVAGRKYRVSKIFQAPESPSMDWLLIGMTGWGGYGVSQAKSVRWHEVSVREATPQEIRDQTVLTPLQATVSTHATTIATQTSQIATLNTTVGTQGSSITTQQSAITTLQGRSAAYWSVTAVAGGRAQLAIYADANGGAGVDIVGDVKINGSLVVTGTVTSTQLAANSASNGSVSYTAGAFTLSTSWQNAASVSVNLIGGAVKLDFGCYIAGTGDGTGTNTQYRILRNGAEIRSGTIMTFPGEQTVYGGTVGENPYPVYTPISGMFPVFMVDLAGVVGAAEYIVQLKLAVDGVQSSANCSERHISVTEFRR